MSSSALPLFRQLLELSLSVFSVVREPRAVTLIPAVPLVAPPAHEAPLAAVPMVGG